MGLRGAHNVCKLFSSLIYNLEFTIHHSLFAPGNDTLQRMAFWIMALVAVLWCGMGTLTFWSLRGATILRANQPTSPLESFPKVSIIIAARNEEEALPAALESILALEYPDFEIVLVDDDSRDHTGAIADEWAAMPHQRTATSAIIQNAIRCKVSLSVANSEG